MKYVLGVRGRERSLKPVMCGSIRNLRTALELIYVAVLSSFRSNLMREYLDGRKILEYFVIFTPL